MTDGVFNGVNAVTNKAAQTGALDKGKAPKNNAPEFTRFPKNGIVKVPEGQKFVFNFNSSDKDGDRRTYSLGNKADGEFFRINPHNGKLFFKKAPDFEHPRDGGKNNVYDVQVILTDAKGAQTKKTIWIKVQDKAEAQNNAPEFTRFPKNGVVHVDENKTFVFNFNSTDKDGDRRTYSLGDKADSGLFKINPHNGRLHFKAAPDFENPTDGNRDNTYDVEVILTDSKGAQTKETIWVKVKDVQEDDGSSTGGDNNGGQTQVGDKTLVNFEGLKAGTIVSNQIDGITVSAERPGSHQNVAMIFDADRPTGGDHDLEVDGQGKILIISEDGDRNDPDDNARGGTFKIGFDKPADVESITVIDIEERGGDIKLFDADGNVIKTVHIPITGDKAAKTVHLGGEHVARMEVSLTGSGAIDEICYKTSAPKNEAPDAVNDDVNIGFGESVDIAVLANDTDPDGDTLTVTSIAGQAVQPGQTVDVANGTATLNANGEITFTPADGFSGHTRFDYHVSDGNGGEDTATVRVDVGERPNGAPQFTNLPENGQIHLDENQTFVIDADATDPDGDDLTYSITGGRDADFFSIDPQTGELSFNEARDFENPQSGGGNNTYDVTITVTDPAGASDTKALWVKIKDVDETPPNQAPDAVNDDVNIGFGESVDIAVLGNDTDPDGDALTVTSIAGEAVQPGDSVDVPNGTATLNADGTITFTPDEGFSGHTRFDYHVSDGNGGEDTATVRVDVGERPNGAPQFTNLPEDGRIHIDENGTFVIDADATDPDGDDLTFEIVGGRDAEFFTIDPQTGELSFNNAPDFENPQSGGNNNTYDVTIRVSDPSGASDTKPLWVKVQDVDETPPNQAPNAVNDDVNIGFGESVDIAVLGNDTDPDGDALTVTSIAGEAVQAGDSVDVPNGTATLNADGTITFTPADGFSGHTRFDYHVSDGNGGEDTAQVRVDVGERPNAAPNADDDSVDTDFGQGVDIAVLGNDTDPDGDALSVTSINGEAVQPGQTVAVANGTATLNANGEISFQPADGFSGPTSFTYHVSDGNGGEDTATVTVNVGEQPNGKPVFTNLPDNGILHINENETFVIDVDAEDPDGDDITYRISGGRDQDFFTIDPQTGELSFKEAPDFENPRSGGNDNTYDVTVFATDSNGNQCHKDLWIKVKDVDETPPNQAPDADDDTIDTDFGQGVDIAVLGNDTDPDGDALTVTSINGEAVQPGQTVNVDNGTATVNADGTVSFQPADGFSGPTSFTYHVSDGNGGEDTATVTVNVGERPNQAPDAVDDGVRIGFGESVDIAVLGNDTDPDGDALTVTSIAGEAVQPGDSVDVPNGTATLNADGTITFTPDEGFSGHTRFDYHVSDGNGGEDTATVRVDVDPKPNSAPTAVDDNDRTNEGEPVIIEVLGNDTDPDGDALSVERIVTQPNNGTASVNADGTITYTPNADFSGTDTFTYEISDGNGGTDIATVTVTVDEVNNAPHAKDDSATGVAGRPETINLVGNDSDPDGDDLTITSIAGQDVQPGSVVEVENGSVRVNGDGTVTVTPAPGFVGTVEFDYHVSDGNGGTDDATVTVNFEKGNSAPVAHNDGYYLRPGIHYKLPVLKNDKDADGDKLTITQINGHDIKPCQSIRVDGGVVTLTKSGELVFKGNRGTFGLKDFSYTVSDGHETSTAKVSVCLIGWNGRH